MSVKNGLVANRCIHCQFSFFAIAALCYHRQLASCYNREKERQWKISALALRTCYQTSSQTTSVLLKRQEHTTPPPYLVDCTSYLDRSFHLGICTLVQCTRYCSTTQKNQFLFVTSIELAFYWRHRFSPDPPAIHFYQRNESLQGACKYLLFASSNRFLQTSLNRQRQLRELQRHNNVDFQKCF